MARHFILATVPRAEIQAKRKVWLKKHWRPAFAGRQNQTQGVEARYTIGVTISGRVMEGLFAFTVMVEAVGDTNHWC
jgi:hypothetical protein